MKGPSQSVPEQWRLDSDEGDHSWRFVSKKEAARRPQSFQEKHFLGLKTDAPKLKPASNFGEAAANGYSFLQKLQLDDGHWACAYGGPSFLLPGLMFAMYITDTKVPPEWKTEIVRYLQNTVNEDGGWGFHAAGPSSPFATGLNYVMLRLFGMDKNVALLENARECFLSFGKWFSCIQI
jgi:lanosterol synthase